MSPQHPPGRCRMRCMREWRWVGGATGPQIAAVALLTLLALGAGVFLAGLSGGLTVSGATEHMPGRRRRRRALGLQRHGSVIFANLLPTLAMALGASSCEDKTLPGPIA